MWNWWKPPQNEGLGVVPPTSDSEIDERRCESKPRALERVWETGSSRRAMLQCLAGLKILVRTRRRCGTRRCRVKWLVQCTWMSFDFFSRDINPCGSCVETGSWIIFPLGGILNSYCLASKIECAVIWSRLKVTCDLKKQVTLLDLNKVVIW
jgi:hypothetical protein